MNLTWIKLFNVPVERRMCGFMEEEEVKVSSAYFP